MNYFYKGQYALFLIREIMQAQILLLIYYNRFQYHACPIVK